MQTEGYREAVSCMEIETKNNQKERQLNFDILRIFSMFMIVFEHGLLNTGILGDDSLSLLNNIAWLLEAFCIVAVNEFFLMAGYFGVRKNFRNEKLIELWIMVEMYSVLFYIISYAVGKSELNLKMILFTMFPVVFKRYWYITVYFVLYLLEPYLNRTANEICRDSYLKLLSVLFFFFCIQPTFVSTEYSLDATGGYGIIWAICLYFLGGYISRFGIPERILKSRICYLGIYILISICMLITEILIVKYALGSGLQSRSKFYKYNSVTVCISSIALFIFFIKLQGKIYFSKSVMRIIKKISVATIGVYLFHTHPELFSFIWSGLEVKFREKNSVVAVLSLILIESLIVFGLGILIEVVRGVLLDRCRKLRGGGRS